MTMHKRWTICAVAALLAAPFLVSSGAPYAAALAQGTNGPGASTSASQRSHSHGKLAARKPTTKTTPAATAQKELPPRVPFTADEDAASVIPGMPDARFWADSVADFKEALPQQPGSWLILSSGGSDGAFGAGLLNGLTAAGKRPDYAVVTGVSTGALMAPFAFAGPRYDDALHKAYTTITAADVFEAGNTTGESFVDSWPLRDTIAKQMTPELLADIAAEHRRGRRLFVVTTNLDCERSVVWNMGAIAAHGGADALNLFRSVLLASASVPGGFPPVLIDVEANGKRFQEMHVDGGLGGQFFVAPLALTASTSDYRLPATQLYVVVNSELQREFKVIERFAPSILTQSIGMAVPVDTRLMLDRIYVAAKRSGVAFNVATIPASFSAPSKGPFDTDYMAALFQTGYEQGRSATPFSTDLPPEPGAPKTQSSHVDKTGAN
jgi:predicted acylesterase/phospholipase RssA